MTRAPARGPALLFLAIVMILAGTGCVKTECLDCGGIGLPKVQLASQSGPETIDAVYPNPCEIDVDFGSLPVGQRASAAIQIEDLGAGTLDISFGAPQLDAAFDLDLAPPLPPQPIEPSTLYSFSVSFEPLDTGPVSSSFAIQTDGVNPECPWPTGSSAGNDITVVLAGTGS
jgi:hypothetical protein